MNQTSRGPGSLPVPPGAGAIRLSPELQALGEYIIQGLFSRLAGETEGGPTPRQSVFDEAAFMKVCRTAHQTGDYKAISRYLVENL